MPPEYEILVVGLLGGECCVSQILFTAYILFRITLVGRFSGVQQLNSNCTGRIGLVDLETSGFVYLSWGASDRSRTSAQ